MNKKIITGIILVLVLLIGLSLGFYIAQKDENISSNQNFFSYIIDKTNILGKECVDLNEAECEERQDCYMIRGADCWDGPEGPCVDEPKSFCIEVNRK